MCCRHRLARPRKDPSINTHLRWLYLQKKAPLPPREHCRRLDHNSYWVGCGLPLASNLHRHRLTIIYALVAYHSNSTEQFTGVWAPTISFPRAYPAVFKSTQRTPDPNSTTLWGAFWCWREGPVPAGDQSSLKVMPPILCVCILRLPRPRLL